MSLPKTPQAYTVDPKPHPKEALANPCYPMSCRFLKTLRVGNQTGFSGLDLGLDPNLEPQTLEALYPRFDSTPKS